MNADEIRLFLDRLATSIEGRDYPGAHASFAPWLQAIVTPDELQGEIEKQLREIGEGFELTELTYPDGHDIGSGFLSYEDLIKEGMAAGKPVPDGVTAENYVSWMCIQFLSQDEDAGPDAWMDWWIAVVRVDDEPKVGYYEILDPD